MKKVLFATTALVAFAGAAAADVSVSGSAEMGIAGGDTMNALGVVTQRNTTFFQSVDVRFSMSGTTDNGLSFGAVIDLEDATEQANNVDVRGAFADYTVFVSGDFGTLTMGDTDGAFDWALSDMGNVGNPGSIGDNETGHAGYNGNGLFDGASAAYQGQVLRYNYSIGDFGFAVSAQVDNNTVRDGDTQLQLGLRYGLDIGGGDVTFGLGYVSLSDRGSNFANVTLAGDQGYSVLGLSAAVVLDGGFSAVINYTDISDDAFFLGDGEHIGIGLGYEFAAFSVHVNYGEYDWATTALLPDSEGWGLAAAYDLGGGVSAHFGYGDSNITAANASAAALNGVSNWTLGLSMSF